MQVILLDTADGCGMLQGAATKMLLEN